MQRELACCECYSPWSHASATPFSLWAREQQLKNLLVHALTALDSRSHHTGHLIPAVDCLAGQPITAGHLTTTACDWGCAWECESDRPAVSQPVRAAARAPKCSVETLLFCFIFCFSWPFLFFSLFHFKSSASIEWQLCEQGDNRNGALPWCVSKSSSSCWISCNRLQKVWISTTNPKRW